MATNFEKFQKLLEELFQLDQADLDFGIYRIMNQKRDEVVRFLEQDLLPQVKEAFSQYKSADKAELQKELDKLVKPITDAGMNPDDSPKVQELRQQMADSSVDVTALENEVFSHLFNFFRRYYHEGDFISLRRYKEGVYAIPYEGEEVKLHWANHDQYYVKSSEYFRDYIFTMPSGKRVRVHLVAASTEQDNKKEVPGSERRFILCEADPIYEENGELFIRFEYRPDDGKKKQDALNQDAIQRILGAKEFDDWLQELSKPAPTKANPKRTVLEKHLTQYTARNTFDYFIHKDLGGFLRRELDFYIKNEVMHLDDIEHDTVPRVEQYLSKIKVIRRIAYKIIQFLEQLENFQKKLWLKKKFVVETNYCITLDRVPKELYPEIAANDAQREEWVKLFAINEIEKDLLGPGYSEPLSVEFLCSQPHLPVDTSFFTNEFRQKLLASIDSLDDTLDGLLIHSENSQALRLLMPRFVDSVDCVYIDPPYNTGNDGFPYKDTYQHSSWITMILNCFLLGRRLLAQDGLFFTSSDNIEQAKMRLLIDAAFGEEQFIEQLVWKNKYGAGAKTKGYISIHEYVLCAAKDQRQIESINSPLTDEAVDAYKHKDEKYQQRGPYYTQPCMTKSMDPRPNLVYPLLYQNNEIWPDKQWIWSRERLETALANDDLVIKRNKSGGWSVRFKQYLRDESGRMRRGKPLSLLNGPYTQEGTEVLTDLIGTSTVNFPKPVGLIEKLIDFEVRESEPDGASPRIVADFFAGSGTTGHAVVNLNRADSGMRKYFLVEMAAHFDTTILPRMKKVVYSKEWKHGKPVDKEGISHAFKYIRLESYEDALNNLELKRSDQQGSLLDEDADLREQYVLSYMLDVESRGSQSLLNVDSFRNPDEYKLKVERNGETQLVNVDLVETFNWLLGLTVKHLDVIRGVRVVVRNESRRRTSPRPVAHPRRDRQRCPRRVVQEAGLQHKGSGVRPALRQRRQ